MQPRKCVSSDQARVVTLMVNLVPPPPLFRFVPQVNRVLKSFNMYFNKDSSGELHFQRKVPRRFQEGFADARRRYREDALRSTGSDGRDGGDGASEVTESDADRTFDSIPSPDTGGIPGLRRRA